MKVNEPRAPQPGNGGVVISNFYTNTHQEVIEITADRLELTLNRHIGRITDRNSWQVPFALLVTMAILFATAEFKSFSWASSEQLQTAFFLLAIAFSVWFLVAILKFFRGSTVSKLICEIKNIQE
jgi:hypothetical protein